MAFKLKFEKNLVEKEINKNKNEHLGKKELAATARQRLPPQKKPKIPRTLLEVFGT